MRQNINGTGPDLVGPYLAGLRHDKYLNLPGQRSARSRVELHDRMRMFERLIHDGPQVDAQPVMFHLRFLHSSWP